ncbi:MAG: tetratricopeptide repeat protein [Verrucomicrobia bacterium]|jgi:tetratricopeptide (TPR) repeat protein|nr:tetratricopeptide repeat protein [Verrucomicrobiota bacterium]
MKRIFPLRNVRVLLACTFLGTLVSHAQALIGPEETPPVKGILPEKAGENPLTALGYKFLKSGDTTAALEQFENALQENEKSLPARLGQAMIFAEQQRHLDAFQAFDIITDQHPRHAFAWNGRGLAAFNLENFDEALLSFKQATAEQPMNGFFYESLAWTLMCDGQFQEAAQSAKQATLMYHKSSESSAYPLLIAYFSYLETGDVRNAQTTLRYAAENKPPNRWPAPVVDYLQGTLTEAELISFVTDTTQETEAHTYIGLKLRKEGEADAAGKHLSWVAQHGDPRVFEYTLARVLNLRAGVALLQH